MGVSSGPCVLVGVSSGPCVGSSVATWLMGEGISSDCGMNPALIINFEIHIYCLATVLANHHYQTT